VIFLMWSGVGQPLRGHACDRFRAVCSSVGASRRQVEGLFANSSSGPERTRRSASPATAGGNVPATNPARRLTEPAAILLPS
jgi:hypothetical protein